MFEVFINCIYLNSMEKYEMLHPIGEGSFGKVYKGRIKGSG